MWQVACTLVVLFLSLCSFARSGEQIEIQVVATHSVTHEARDNQAVLDKAIFGADAPTRHTESYNLDTIINGEHVLLACNDSKGCEAPKIGAYEGTLRRKQWLKLTFTLPLSDKRVSRWYKIAGSW